MKRRDVESALRGIGARVIRTKGGHDIWGCSCGQHTTAVPRHAQITAGVVRSIEKQVACEQGGWLQ